MGIPTKRLPSCNLCSSISVLVLVLLDHKDLEASWAGSTFASHGKSKLTTPVHYPAIL